VGSHLDESRGSENWTTLGLPLRARGACWLATLALAAYYVATMSRDLSLYDSGELALAADQLGLGHPPGQPLHTLLGFIAARIFVGAPLIGLNLLSSLPAALTLLPSASIAQTLCRSGQSNRRIDAVLPWLLGLCGLHQALWEPATRVEVYALATFCALWAIARVLPLCIRGAPRPTRSQFFGVGLAIGLCASVNPVIALAVAIGLGPSLVQALQRRYLSGPALLALLFGGVLGLLPYVYLPLTAARSDVMVWGGLRDYASWVRYLSMRDYAHNQRIDAATFLAHAGAWFGWALRNLLLPLLILGTGGHMRAAYRLSLGRSIALLIAACSLAFISFNVIWQLDVPDYNGYMAGVYWLAAAGSAALLASALRSQRRFAAISVGACVVSCTLAPPAPWARTRQHDQLARDLAEQVLHEAPAGAIVIALADHFAGSLFYLQQAEHARPDVVVLAFGLSGSSWHWRDVQRLHPELHEFALRGPAGRAGRVRRWLAANPDRLVLVERWTIARELGLLACPGGLYLRTEALCKQAAPPDRDAPQLLARQLALLGAGAPGAAGAIADVSDQIGEGLWRMGWTRAAHDVLLAGVPRALWPQPLAAGKRLTEAPALARALPDWQRTAALGDPARNLFLAGAIAAGSGQSEAAARYLDAAARAGLPEATAQLARER
jgi:hypothetical protein